MEIFKTFEHNGKVLQLAAYEPKSSPRPARPSTARKPGAGKFEIGAIQLSAAEISAGEEITLSAQINGKNIAFVYTDILLHDKNSGQAYGPVLREHLPAERNKEIKGVAHPDWDETINISVTLRPSLPLLTDSENFAFGFLTPEGYAVAGHRLEGLYNDGTRTRITFTEAGEIKTVTAFKEQRGPALPHELSFKSGDTFTPFVQIYTPPAEENKNWETKMALSNPLTFGDQSFRCQAEAPMPGEYLIGILVQDLDGGLARKYVPLKIGK
jgi:hypothetical protein